MPLQRHEQSPTPFGRGRVEPRTLARFLPRPENRAALAAVQEVLACVCSARTHRRHSPLYLHGPAGSGKSHLAAALVHEVIRQAPDRIICSLLASDFTPRAGRVSDRTPPVAHAPGAPVEEADPLDAARGADVFVLEDLHHLAAAGDELLVQLFDFLQARDRQMVFTALVGPRSLTHLSYRLTSRLACGLLVGLEPLQAPSRLALLRDRAQRRQLAVSEDVLAWLAEHLAGGGRQLEGAIAQLELLSRLSPCLGLVTVTDHFRDQVEAGRPTVERIAERVGGYFRVQPRQMQSRRRSRQVLLPRQVGMYLARQLTELSLEQIGAYFGGRDHSTVLHACRKVEDALGHDAVLSGAVRQLQAELV